ncbi:hypothetical protein E5676_scaffold66G00440 [Cucumis melo var. makuwa]|uniref:Uncharacterized protein n=1 Tax=Cucumis melo var. makuwa TaxID=1194695 RepID=A0A5D3CGN5_CUCMM|nr:hypothetical protein E5676_scaffold66G00440 [Cucumis melo var. makuwa]
MSLVFGEPKGTPRTKLVFGEYEGTPRTNWFSVSPKEHLRQSGYVPLGSSKIRYVPMGSQIARVRERTNVGAEVEVRVEESWRMTRSDRDKP